jgi:hypothetical protein
LVIGKEEEREIECFRVSNVLAPCDGVPPQDGAGTPTREERVTGEKVS